jgi:hypothetical protein
MTLHLFNPEHDLALAFNHSRFTAPHVARQLHSDFGFIPSLWADTGDVVLVDDKDVALRAYNNIKCKVNLPDVHFVTPYEISSLYINKVEPWGWDKSLNYQIRQLGIEGMGDESLATIRQLSSRQTAVNILPQLIGKLTGVCGESRFCTRYEEIEECLYKWKHIVLKMPWCSSGRGLRFVDLSICAQLQGWIKNVLAIQYGLAVEPYYNKVKDFGMEFESDGMGKIEYLGLSLFSTENGAYTGNIIATEHTKMKSISRYISTELLNRIKVEIKEIMSPVLKGKYCGVFGVDMMIVTGEHNEGFLLHPCVEINLRKTMGYAALALTPADDEIMYQMHTEYSEGKFKLKVNTYKSKI